MEMMLGRNEIEVRGTDDVCMSCRKDDGNIVSFKTIFLCAYKKAFRNADERPSKQEAYDYVKDFVDIDVSDDELILCEACIEELYQEVVEILQNYEE